MKPSIEYDECLRDSPAFRYNYINYFINFVIIIVSCEKPFRKYLDDEEISIEHLEQKLEKILKLCTLMIDSGKDYVKNQRYKYRVQFHEEYCSLDTNHEDFKYDR